MIRGEIEHQPGSNIAQRNVCTAREKWQKVQLKLEFGLLCQTPFHQANARPELKPNPFSPCLNVIPAKVKCFLEHKAAAVQRQRMKKRKRLYDGFWQVACVCVFVCVCVSECVCVSKWEGPPVVYLRHSVHQRRSVLFVLLHHSVSDGSLMVMSGRALAAGTDATLGWGRPSHSSSPPWRVLHASLVVTIHTDLWKKRISTIWFHTSQLRVEGASDQIRDHRCLARKQMTQQSLTSLSNRFFRVKNDTL